MMGEIESDYSLDRRTALRCIISGVSATIAGCGDTSRTERRPGKTPLGSMNSSEEHRTDALDETAEDVREIFDRLSQFPIVRNSEFVFEVRTVEDEFDFEELIENVQAVKARLEALELEDSSGSQKADLLLVTEVAENLIRQRIVVHQIIAAGITFEESFGKGEYGRASEVIQDGTSFLEVLSDNRKEIIDLVTQDVTPSSLAEAYDAESILETQVVLGEILRWTSPAYVGLYEAVEGLQKFEGGNSALDSEEFESARYAYREAGDRFRSAAEAFDRAQGRGRRLPQIAPFVDGVRCMLEAYQNGSDDLRKSMHEFEAGNDSKAKGIGRDAIISTKRIADRC